MMPAHFHNLIIQVLSLYACTQKESTAAAAVAAAAGVAAAAVVRECSWVNVPAAAHISAHIVETHRVQSLQMLPAHFHTFSY